MEGYIKIEELIKYLQEKDLVITERRTVIKNRYRESLLRKKWLKLKEIQHGELWGKLSKEQVTRIAKNETGRMELRKNEKSNKPFWEVSIDAVVRIGEIRHTL